MAVRHRGHQHRQLTVDDLLDIGVDEGSPGTVILNGEASTLEVGGDLTAGDAETGTLEVATGAFAYAAPSSSPPNPPAVS